MCIRDRIGAIHSVVFAGFSSNALATRIDDCKSSIIITSDGSFRGEKILNLKKIVDDALEICKSDQKVLMVINRFIERLKDIFQKIICFHL